MNAYAKTPSKPRAGLLDRREFLATAGAGLSLILSENAQAQVPDTLKPNTIVIMADDLGYGDLGVHGCKDIPTPHIDSLAQNGVRFTNGYVSCPVCSPTRAGLMTGRYQQRFGHWYNPGPPNQAAVDFGLPLSEITLADLLKQAGYATGMVGKWHLGLKPQFHPMKRGFDEYFGFLHGAHSYIDAQADAQNPIMRGTEAVDEKEYLTDAFTREAVSYIQRHVPGPFFLYLAYNAVHTPMQAPQKYLDRFPGIADPKRQTYCAMLSAMDDGVGAVLEVLRKSGVEQDTLIFFVSDNGGPTKVNGSTNTPLSGDKGTIQEGGIRVPFFLQWPSRLPAGKVYDRPMIALDILPTCVAAAQATLPTDRPLDGVNLVPYVLGQKTGAPHDALFWKWHEGDAVRWRNWKLVKSTEGTAALYNLAADVAETRDVASAYPRIVKRISKKLARWESVIKPPLWEPRRPQANRQQTPGPSS